VEATYAILDGGVAVMEMSAAAGITLIPAEARDPMKTTTYGVGEMIRDAIDQGCRSFLMGIGGSATNDGGAGMLQALGFDLLDETGAPIEKGARGLEKLHAVCAQNADPLLKNCEFRIACDVTNPLCGNLGCSAVYGPQKGATSENIPLMDGWLARYAELAKSVNEAADPDLPGAGAAGGLGFAFSAFLGGKLQSGISLVLDAICAEDHIKKADIVLTGEGRLDGQSAMGKAPVGVASLAKKHGKPVIAFAGCVSEEADKCNEVGIDAFFPILRGVLTLDEAMDKENAKRNLEKTAEQAFRLIHTFQK
jgi:glycerate kinase